MVTFEFCALYYLNWWSILDRKFVKAFSSGNLEKIMAILPAVMSSYRISRNFSMVYDVDSRSDCRRFEPVANIINDSKITEVNHSNYIEVVNNVREQIRVLYKKDLLSATTKLLWMKYRSPIIIYDNNAATALHRLGYRIKPGDYEGYASLWKKYYAEVSGDIETACKKLSSIRKFAESANETFFSEEYIRDITSQEWFRERVLDIYFWHAGRKGVQRKEV